MTRPVTVTEPCCTRAPPVAAREFPAAADRAATEKPLAPIDDALRQRLRALGYQP